MLGEVGSVPELRGYRGGGHDAFTMGNFTTGNTPTAKMKPENTPERKRKNIYNLQTNHPFLGVL